MSVLENLDTAEVWEARTLAYLAGEMPAGEAADLEAALDTSEAARNALSQSRAVLEVLQQSGTEATERTARALLQTALAAGATDLQMTPDANGMNVRMRVAGAWHESEKLPISRHQEQTDWWKTQINADLTERRVPQNGRITFTHNGNSFDGRVVVVPTFWGEAVYVHLTNRSQIRLGLDNIGLRPEQMKTLRQIIASPNGLVLTGGPKASGKSTLLYCLLHDLQVGGDGRNCVSIEDPVETTLAGIAQTPINREAGLSFTSALRAFLLTEPDVIYCSQIKNEEAARLTLDAALGGALVLSTVAGAHSAWGGVEKLRQLGMDNFSLAACIVGLVGQRLVRTFAPDTVLTSDTPHPGDLNHLGLSPIEDGPFLQAASGPLNGFAPVRTALFEIAAPDVPVLDALAHGAGTNELWAMTLGRRGQSLRDEAAYLVRQKQTTVREAARALAGYEYSAGEPSASGFAEGAALDFAFN